jgi:hypothetical protein
MEKPINPSRSPRSYQKPLGDILCPTCGAKVAWRLRMVKGEPVAIELQVKCGHPWPDMGVPVETGD